MPYAAGNPLWYEASERRTPEAEAKSPAPVLVPGPNRRRRINPSKIGSHEDKAGEIEVVDAAAPAPPDRDPDAAMAFGSAVHAVFERIGWLPEDGEALEVHLAGHPDPAVAAVVRRCLEAPDIREVFERQGGDVELLREQPFDLVDDATWVSGIVDRLVLHRESGRVVRAEVIDFKTDRVGGASELAARHGAQMEAYRAAVAQITGLDPKRVRCALVSTGLLAVVEV